MLNLFKYRDGMTNPRKNIATDNKQSVSFSNIERYHPYKTFLFFALVGITFLFMSFSGLYFYTISHNGVPENFVLPKEFSVSTVILLLSSFSIMHLTRAFRNDSFFDLKISFLTTIIFAFTFCYIQIMGWKAINANGFSLEYGNGITYLYIISGIHLLHVLGGIIYISVLAVQAQLTSTNVAKTIMYFSDDYHLTKLQLVQVYWHFINILWVFLFFMFLFSF
jgi:cytochrome c oxidase subunit III